MQKKLCIWFIKSLQPSEAGRKHVDESAAQGHSVIMDVMCLSTLNHVRADDTALLQQVLLLKWKMFY